MSSKIRYLTQKEAALVDDELMNESSGFHMEQLMELAGLSVASAILEVYPPIGGSSNNVLVLCGPGNNGGDGLVAARDFKHFGYDHVDVFYPKRTDKPLYYDLVKQAKGIGANFLDVLPSGEEISHRYGVIVDALFGYSFKGDIRPPFDSLIKEVNKISALNKIPVASIDIPSGWDVEKGNVNGLGFEPSLVISLTAPKLCMRHFKGRHFLGGRFVPIDLDRKLDLHLPKYEGSKQHVEIFDQ